MTFLLTQPHKKKKQASELAQANQVKSEFLSVMSHELRTPLNLIMGYAGVMQDQTLAQINQEQESSLNKIMRCSHDLLEMIISIMEASRIEAGKTNPRGRSKFYASVKTCV